MKKLLLVLSLSLVPALGYCLNQPQNVGSIKADVLALPIVTVAQMNALTPDATGQIIFVSDAATSSVCVSTGAAAATKRGAFVGAAFSTGTFSPEASHCN